MGQNIHTLTKRILDSNQKKIIIRMYILNINKRESTISKKKITLSPQLEKNGAICFKKIKPSIDQKFNYFS